ncbi:MAG: MarR family transcriptional regulator [Bacillota bacterium]|nr:MarR family transcriptional regulator [Bacillota bacterium]
MLQEEIKGFLNDLFYQMRKIEESALSAGLNIPVSITEIHILEKIGPGGAARMGDIASMLGVTLATLTVACDKLEGKGLIEKKRGGNDKRAVQVTLTDSGIMAYRFHENFQKGLVEAALHDLTGEEQRLLGLSVKKLEAFFEKQAKKEISGIKNK